MKELDKNDLKFAFESSRCNNHTFDEWYEYNYGIKEPMKGEVWTISFKGNVNTANKSMIIRVGCGGVKDLDEGEKNISLSKINFASEFDVNDGFGYYQCDMNLRPATPEEISKLEKAERENGYWWNGEELEEIRLEIGKYYKYRHGRYVTHYFKVTGINSDCDIFYESITDMSYLDNIHYIQRNSIVYNKSIEITKEEYEAKKITLLGQSNCSGNISSEEHDDVDDYKAKFYELKNELERLSKL